MSRQLWDITLAKEKEQSAKTREERDRRVGALEFRASALLREIDDMERRLRTNTSNRVVILREGHCVLLAGTPFILVDDSVRGGARVGYDGQVLDLRLGVRTRLMAKSGQGISVTLVQADGPHDTAGFLIEAG